MPCLPEVQNILTGKGVAALAAGSGTDVDAVDCVRALPVRIVHVAGIGRTDRDAARPRRAKCSNRSCETDRTKAGRTRTESSRYVLLLVLSFRSVLVRRLLSACASGEELEVSIAITSIRYIELFGDCSDVLSTRLPDAAQHCMLVMGGSLGRDW